MQQATATPEAPEAPATPAVASPSTTSPAQTSPVAPETAQAAPAAPNPEPPAVLADKSPSALPMDPDAIDAFLRDGKPLEVPANAVEGEAGEPSATPDPDPATPAEPVAPEAPPVEPTDDGNLLPNRISTAQFDPIEQQALALKHQLAKDGKIVPLDECMARARKMFETESPAAPTPPEPTRLESLEKAITDGQQALTDLRAERARLQSEDAELNREEISELDTKIDAANRELVKNEVRLETAREQTEAEQQRAEAQRLEADKAARKSAKDEILREFPTAGDTATPLGARVAKLVTALKDPAHPDHDLLFAKNAARYVTERAATEEAKAIAARDGIPFAQAYAALRATAPAQPTASPKETTPQPRKVLPAAGGKTTPVTAAKTEAQIMAEIGMDPDAASAALYGNNPSQWMIGAPA